MKPRLVVVGPVPPPYHGVSVSTSLVLANPGLRDRFEVTHLDTSDRRTVANVGNWDLQNVGLALAALPRLLRTLQGPPGVLYLPISQGIPGLARDSLFIHLAVSRGWRVATHLRGSELGGVFRRQPAPLRWWLGKTLSRVSGVAVLGNSLAGVLDGLVPRERVAVVPNGTPDPGPRNRARRRTGVYLGNLYRRKGGLQAIQAAAAVAESRPDSRFIFAGDAPEKTFAEELRRVAARSGGRISVVPPIYGDEKRDLLLSADFMLFPPSRQEGHPRVVLEGMAAGLPVITTNRGAISETVIDEECGFVLPMPDPHDLADRIRRLVDDPDLCEKLGAAARERYLQNYTQERSDQQMTEWLASLAPPG